MFESAPDKHPPLPVISKYFKWDSDSSCYRYQFSDDKNCYIPVKFLRPYKGYKGYPRWLRECALHAWVDLMIEHNYYRKEALKEAMAIQAYEAALRHEHLGKQEVDDLTTLNERLRRMENKSQWAYEAAELWLVFGMIDLKAGDIGVQHPG